MKINHAHHYILSCLNDRFEQDGLEKYSNMQNLLLLAASKKSYEKELKDFLTFYKDDFDEDLLEAQLKTFSNNFQKENATFEDIISYFKESSRGIQSLLSEVGRIVKLVLILPASNATSERSFSKMKLIYDYLRSTMSQERVNHFMILGIYPELLDSMDSTKIAGEFIRRKTRREHVFGKEKKEQ